MQISINDSTHIYTADQDYDGPDGTLLKGEQFRVLDFYEDYNLALVSMVNSPDIEIITIRVDEQFNVISD